MIGVNKQIMRINGQYVLSMNYVVFLNAFGLLPLVFFPGASKSGLANEFQVTLESACPPTAAIAVPRSAPASQALLVLVLNDWSNI